MTRKGESPTVFLVHDFESAGIAQQLIERLSRHGLAVMRADLVPAGSGWREAVGEAMRASDAILVLVTTTSASSFLFDAEVAAAVAVRTESPEKAIIPVLAAPDVEVPLFLQDLVALRLSDGPPLDRALEDLAASLRHQTRLTEIRS